MSKRSLSSPPLPPSKRLHRRDGTPDAQPSLLTPAFPLSNEIILYIFSHLSWVDLCAAQATNRAWSRLAIDNELWRKMYLTTFGRPRLRGGRGAIGLANGRAMNPLPSGGTGDEIKDWKWMFRISSNWRKGRCTVENLHAPPAEATEDSHQTHILLTGSLIISASSRPSSSPWIGLSGLRDLFHKLHCPTNQSGLYQITALAQDQSLPKVNYTRIVAFLHNGEFCIFHVDHSNPASSRLHMAHTPIRRFARSLSVIRAVYHHPVLVALSESFTLSIYDLSSGSIRHLQTLASYTSYPPTSLVLSAPSPESYKLVLTYSVPVYPRHWSVGVTEFIISGPTISSIPSTSKSSLSSFLHQSSSAQPMSVASIRSIRAVDIPQGWMDEDKLRYMQEQWSRKVARVSDAQTDGKWVILVPADPAISGGPSSPGTSVSNVSSMQLYSPTSLQLYRLSLPSPSPSVSASRPKLTFVRNLHGHTTPVSSIAVADGRCVSLGMDGNVWIWDLEAGTSTEASGAIFETAGMLSDTHVVNGTVIFDERRIVSARGGDIMIRRFDV
ncbi:hypothetical protein APHAL10511_004837 [Amanita phalloides]|nr:hypothetical protein APHAL10511_004837 [Amanita phalloides]